MITINSADALDRKRMLLWQVIRFLIPSKPRWFFEGHPKMIGQLSYHERKLLYTAVKNHRPQTCFEIGTWKGGGSTLFISQALKENGAGMLHTIEIDRHFFDEARRNYQTFLPQLLPHVTFHFGDYKEIYTNVLKESGHIDFLFLDGAEDGEQTLEQYRFFEPYLRPGSVVLAHDWLTEKARLIHPIFEDVTAWDLKQVLLPPKSVGMAYAVKK